MAEINKEQEFRKILRDEMIKRLRNEIDTGKEIEFEKKPKAQVAPDLNLDLVLDIKINKAVKDIEALRKDLDLNSLDDAIKNIESLRKDFGLDPLDLFYIHHVVKDIEALCKDLGIPIVSSVEELNPNSTVIFVSNHKDYTEPQELNKILLQKLRNKKTILGAEFSSNLKDLLNDPTRNLTDFYELIIPYMNFKETILGLLRVFNNIQQTYSIDRFEIEPVDLRYAEILFRRPDDKEFDKKRAAKIVENIRDVLKKYGGDNLVVYTGASHAEDLLTKLKESIESGNKEGIKIDNMAVYLTTLDRVICDFIDMVTSRKNKF